MYLLISYIKFLFRSTNQHGVHSPFVYSLLTECLYKEDEKSSFNTISRYIKAIRQDNRVIQVKDFGAGSRVFKSNNRKVSKIAKNAGISQKRAILLNKLTSYLEIKYALELGTSVGISSAAIGTGNIVRLTSLEGCPATAQVAREYFKQFKIDNIEVKIGEFESILCTEKFLKRESKISEHTSRKIKKPFDLIYFDGNHQKEATLKYFNMLLPYAHNESVFIFDDIHWSSGMEAAWNTIRAHPKVRVSIDSFFWGIVFFRREQEKEHFNIRL